jgi:pimeloyl-ACP methyl ester carboxylesterase
VVFDAGVGGFSLEWIKIQRELHPRCAVHVPTIAPATAGVNAGPSPRTHQPDQPTSYRRLLQRGRDRTAYVLVGHSFGGYNMQYYAKTRTTGQVAAVILIDSSHPEQSERMPTGKGPSSLTLRGRSIVTDIR